MSINVSYIPFLFRWLSFTHILVIIIRIFRKTPNLEHRNVSDLYNVNAEYICLRQGFPNFYGFMGRDPLSKTVIYRGPLGKCNWCRKLIDKQFKIYFDINLRVQRNKTKIIIILIWSLTQSILNYSSNVLR